MSKSGFSLGVDVGGTFTDVVVLDETSGQISIGKVLTTPQSPSEAIVSGAKETLAQNSLSPQSLSRVVHGTTLVTNTIIERKGAKTALVTTKGFRDTLEIGRTLRYDLYDLSLEFPAPLVDRSSRFEVDERIDANGIVLRALDENELRTIAEQLLATGIEVVAIVFLHSHRNPDHELRAREILQAMLPMVHICISSEVVGELREFDRTSTAVANAYVLPRMANYLGFLSEELRGIQVAAPLRLMLSSGGVATVDFGRKFPIQLIESGPAAGVIAACHYGRLAGVNDLLSFDMGGTTAKLCLVTDETPSRSHTFEAARVKRFQKGSGLLLRVPVIELIEIGAGGGSMARVDKMGLIKVGPESSGAEPGPACYGRGGTAPTVTDADVVLGYIAPESFLGGRMKLDRARAEAAINTAICVPTGLGLVDAAAGIQKIVDETMASASRIYAAEKGVALNRYSMLTFGGAGPVHAFQLATLLKLPRIICPFGAGAASALGFLVAAPSVEFARSYFVRLADISWSHVEAFLDDLKRRAESMLVETGVDSSLLVYTVQIEMSYVGQGFEIDVTLPLSWLKAGAPGEALRNAFEAEYQRRYGTIMHRVSVQAVTWRLIAAAPSPAFDPSASRSESVGRSLKGRRAVYFPGRAMIPDVPVYDRYHLQPGDHFHGPAVFEEHESTFVVGFGSNVVVDKALNLVAELHQ